jgi:threonine dehydrogenase-like Zn-dependent dehydrogenase
MIISITTCLWSTGSGFRPKLRPLVQGLAHLPGAITGDGSGVLTSSFVNDNTYHVCCRLAVRRSVLSGAHLQPLDGGAVRAVPRPSASRAAVLRGFGQISVEDVPLPARIDPGALLVRVEMASVCGTDVHLWEGVLSRTPDLPTILGHEMVGRIVEIGQGAVKDSFGTPLAEGDRVLWTHANCNRCYYCTDLRQPVFCDNRRLYMYENIGKEPHLLGGFTRYSYVLPGSERIRVPDAISSELATMASCAFRSVIHAFDVAGRLDPSWTVVVQGTGALGLLAVHMARQAGVRNVVAIGDPAGRLDLARGLGADTAASVSGTTREERLALVRSLTQGRGADVVLEFTGAGAAVAEGLDLLRKAGRFVLVGQLQRAEVPLAPSLITIKGLQVLGSSSGSIEHYRRALAQLEKDGPDTPLVGLLGQTYALTEIEDAFRAVQELQEIKPLVDPWL